ncbi:MAG TPA: hypothetical protein VHM19_20780 [Polyangiales bacterium]|jgi:ABC-type phosphate transport system substrate-binding protein|nr:hypothetical protein [Polyangiales bacterium]
MDALCSRRDFLAGCGALLAGAYAAPALALNDPLCVIVSIESPQTELHSPQLRRVFLGQPTNDARGQRFIPINAAAGSRERIDFDERVLGMSSEEVARFWIDQRIRGLSAPRSTASLDVILRVVARLPGAISYVPRAWLRPNIKVLRLDGKLPGEKGYLLQR